MPTVRLQISPTPAHVRTARLVATAVARRGGVADGALDEIRFAVGEACARAVDLHERHAPDQLVTMLLQDEGEFVVTVLDAAPAGAETTQGDPLEELDRLYAQPGDGDGPMPAGFGLAVIGGLVDDLEISPIEGGRGTVVRMSWPLAGSAAAQDLT
ncbi:MAG: ATP-binding protein [Actinomycetota bacterium]|nr:ATP-binding protein [Actinomycetota bacterium]